MNPIQQAHVLGQSVWLDYIRRDLITSGELEHLVQAGEIRGVTSNPTIFEKAISGSELYTASLRPLAQAGWEVERIFDALALEDIRAAARVFLPLYEETNGRDGFVSIEVNPRLADDTSGTLGEVRRLWDVVNRPNVMIKIPATKAGISAIEQAISEGINVNVTLIFSLDRYNQVMEAYLRGLEDRLGRGASLDHVASVASFFVSRIDSMVDDRLEAIVHQERQDADRAAALTGKIAIASAKIAYAQFKAIFSGPRFERLSEHGARVQRPLWASTSTKNPSYSDTYYVDHLIGPNTVNTLPPQTLDAFRDHGVVEPTLEQDLSVSRAQMEALRAIQISIETVTQELEREGVAKFAHSYTSLLKTLRSRVSGLRKEIGPLLEGFQATLEELAQGDVARRIWERDGGLWTKKAKVKEKISQSLGWLTLPHNAQHLLEEIDRFTAELHTDGLNQAVFLGVGGISLTADVLQNAWRSTSAIKLSVVDSTHPAIILKTIQNNPVSQTLWIIADKSGMTDETLNLMEYFWGEVSKEQASRAGEFFVAITEPGSVLEEIARERVFRQVFLSSPEVRDLYTPLSVSGLLPATLLGLNAEGMLHGAAQMADACGPAIETSQNPGLYLGALLKAAHDQGRDKLTIVADPELNPLLVWIAKLIEKTTSTEGSGFLPILHESLGSGKVYGEDRLMIYLRSNGSLDQHVQGWMQNRLPVVVQQTGLDESNFGSMFFMWEFAAAVVSHLIGVNPFSPVDFRRTQRSTRAMLKAFEKRGSLPHAKDRWTGEGLRLRGNRDISTDLSGMSLEQVIQHLLSQWENGILRLTFYLDPETVPVSGITEFRASLRDRLGISSTLGWGPQYLSPEIRSEKKEPSQDVYLLITSDFEQDLPVPGKGYPFGVSLYAHALHDLQVVEQLAKRAFILHLDSPARLGALLESFHEVTQSA